MKKQLLGLSFFLIFTHSFGQNLIEIPQHDVINVKHSSLATSDIDGDGKPDLYVAGVDNGGNVINAFYTNNGYGTFQTDNSYIANVSALSNGSSTFYDTNGDGIGDWLLVSGMNATNQGVVELYKLVGASYVNTGNNFQGITKGKAEFIDYDGDGNIDIFIAGENGATAVSAFYKNDGAGNFSAVSFANIVPMKKGAFAFGQFSNSGNQTDLFFTGISTANNDTLSYIYKYQANDYVLVSDTLLGYVDANVTTYNFSSTTYKDIVINGIEKATQAQYVNAFTFGPSGYTGQGIIATNYTHGDFVIDDFDMDGRADMVLTGKRNSNQTLNSQLLIASPSANVLGNSFANDATTVLEPLFEGQALSFDFEGDGDIDLIITGTNENGESDTRLYRNINVCQTSSGIDVIQACDSIVWIDGNTYSSSNNTAQYTIENGNIWGCDSLVTLNLAITQTTYHSDNRGTVCDSLTWINGQVINQTTSGLEYTVGQNVAGCDSIVVLDVIIKHSSFVDYNITECEQYKWEEGNGLTYNYSQNNVLYYLGPNSQGCDSMARLNLTINNPQIRTDNITACVEYTWIDGNTYSNDNSTATYLVGTASNGCDSIAKLNLVISNILLGDDYVETCHPYTWIDGHTYYDSTSSVTYTMPSQHGCDSIVTLHLTFNHIDTELIVVNGVPHVRPMDDATYQWINCSTGHAIAGATDTIYNPGVKGRYACVVTYKQCSDTSICYNYGFTSVNDVDNISSFVSVYPNPSEGEVTIKVDEVFDWVEVNVFDVTGKQVKDTQFIDKTTNSISLYHLPKGVYMIKIDTDLGSSQERIVVQ